MKWPTQHEMRESGVDWLGNIPINWRVTKLAWHATCSSGSNLQTDLIESGSSTISNIPVIGGNGVMGFTNTANTFADQLAVGRVGALCGNVHKVPGPTWITDNALQINITGDFDLDYLMHVLSARNLNNLASKTAQPLITGSLLSSQRLPHPEIKEQRAIVNFLARETAKIDALITKQEQLITTLRENRDCVWGTALDFLAADWPALPLRRVIDSIVDGPFGSSLSSAHYTSSGVRVIRLGNIGINQFRNEDHAFISEGHARTLAYHNVNPGDVIVAGLGDEKMPLGRAVVVPQIGPAIVKADCFRIRTKAKLMSASYLAWALSSPPTRGQIAQMARGSTRSRLNTSVIRDVTIPVPPLDVQLIVVEQCLAELAKLDELIAKSTEMITTLREYRSALITDAVTGKIDVRGVA